MKPATAGLILPPLPATSAQIAIALTAAQHAGMARAREVIIAAVEAEAARVRVAYAKNDAAPLMGPLGQTNAILALIRSLDIAMPSEDT